MSPTGISLPKLKRSCHSDICARMFIAVQLAMVKSWKQQKCPSTADRVDEKDVVRLGLGI